MIAYEPAEIKIVIFQSVSECQRAKWMMMVKLQPSCSTFSMFALLNSEVIAPTFTKILYDVDALVQLLIHTFTKRRCILFQNARTKSEDGQFWRVQKGPKVNRLP